MIEILLLVDDLGWQTILLRISTTVKTGSSTSPG